MLNRVISRVASADVGVVTALSLIWALAAFAVNPKGDFALNDDWAYGLPALALTERGTIRFTDWNCPTAIAQVIWGTLFCLPAGFSYTALRASTLVLGLVGVVGLYGLLRNCGAPRWIATMGALCMMANPIYLALSCSFMTDVPYIALTTLAVSVLVRGVAAEDALPVWLGLGLVLVAVFIRQTALAIFLGVLITSPLRRRPVRAALVQGVLPILVAVLALKSYEWGLRAIDQLPRDYYVCSEATMVGLRALAHLEIVIIRVLSLRLSGLLMYVGLFTVPFSIMLWPRRLARLSSCDRLIEVSWVAAWTVLSTGALGMAGATLPMFDHESYWIGAAIGPRFLIGYWPQPAPWALRLVITAIAAIGGASF